MLFLHVLSSSRVKQFESRYPWRLLDSRPRRLVVDPIQESRDRDDRGRERFFFESADLKTKRARTKTGLRDLGPSVVC